MRLEMVDEEREERVEMFDINSIDIHLKNETNWYLVNGKISEKNIPCILYLMIKWSIINVLVFGLYFHNLQKCGFTFPIKFLSIA